MGRRGPEHHRPPRSPGRARDRIRPSPRQDRIPLLASSRGPCPHGLRPQLVKFRKRLRALEKEVCLKVSREIVRVACRLACGIKFERLFSHRAPSGRGGAADSYLRVQQMVEARARRAGVVVLYVDPTATSKRCHRCGAIGRRHRKRFECPACGLVAHADVNAAITIAFAPCRRPEETRSAPSRRSPRRRARCGAGIRTTFEGLPAFLDGRICWSDGLPPSGWIPGRDG